eukprot:8354541-Pyramimonas_sp.AAC.1
MRDSPHYGYTTHHPPHYHHHLAMEIIILIFVVPSARCSWRDLWEQETGKTVQESLLVAQGSPPTVQDGF